MTIGYILLFGSMLLYLALVGWAMPQGLLRERYARIQSGDRGVRRCLFMGKRCTVYEMARKSRKYIKKYLLCQESEYKTLRCHLAPGVRYVEYDAVLFNRYHKIFDVIRVKESPSSVYTASVRLPDETAYISLRLRRVNKTELDTAPLLGVPRGKMVLYAFLVCLLTLLQALVLKVACAYAFGGVFREDFIFSVEGTLYGAGLALALALLGLAFALIPLRVRSKK